MKKTIVFVCSVGLLSMAFASTASARAQRVGQVPNGASFSCGLCHTMPSGGPRNAFGQQVEETLTEPGAAGAVDWSAVYDLDADGDGATNGAELGDAEGTWVPGDPSPDEFSDPNDADSTPESPDVNNGENNGANNGGNNGANNGGNNGDGGDGSDDGGDDGGCSTAPGQTGAGGFAALVLGALFLVTRRRN